MSGWPAVLICWGEAVTQHDHEPSPSQYPSQSGAATRTGTVPQAGRPPHRCVRRSGQDHDSPSARVEYERARTLSGIQSKHRRECPGKVPHTGSLRDQSFPCFPRHSPELRISGVEADRSSHSKHSGGSVPNARELDLLYGTDAFEVVVFVRTSRRDEAVT